MKLKNYRNFQYLPCLLAGRTFQGPILSEDRVVIAFGPVHDPKAAFGFRIIEAEGEETVKSFIANDPANG